MREDAVGIKVSHNDFVHRAVAFNRKVLTIIALFSIVLELFSCFYYFVFKDMTISDLFAQGYLAFHLSYIGICLLFLLVDKMAAFNESSRYRFYMLLASVLLFWHLFYNCYYIYHSQDIGCFTVVTAIFLFSGFLIFKPVYTFANLSVFYLSFIIFLKLFHTSNEILSFSTTVVLCAVVYLVRYKHLNIEIIQSKQLLNMQQELSDTKRDFSLTVEQHELLRERENSITFEWDIQNDWIRFSKEWNKYFDEPIDIVNFREYIKNQDLLTDEQKKTLYTCLENVKNGMAYQKYELNIPTKTKEIKCFEVQAITQTNTLNEPVFGIGMLTDITDRKAKINQLETEIQMDLFTGLLNKTSIERHGERKLADLQPNERLAALILDMDDFKDINDKYGHPVGDYVLKEVAKILRENIPLGVRLGRIGGDEFMALFVAKDFSAFEAYAQNLVQKVADIKWLSEDIPTSCSIGLTYSLPDETYAELYRRTDEAMYQAKHKGKNQLYISL